MQIIPAIDIKNGKCVRLVQGNFAEEKIYSDDPVAIAKQWEQQGAQMLHVVDLDGAKNGTASNFEVIQNIVQSITIPIQVGGGIRNKKSVEKLLTNGVARVILGTIALEDEDELKNILQDFGTNVAIALDTKNGKLMKQGWIKEDNANTITTAVKLERLGVKRFIYTDVVKDGTMTEPNFVEIENLKNAVAVPIIVGGGISNVEQIEKLKTMGVEGIIIGKALYENKITFKEALNVS